MFAEITPEQLVAAAHSGLQSGIRVGHEAIAALDRLTRGASRVWLDARHIPMPKHSVQKALDSLRYDWWPDPASYQSAETLHHDATEALRKLIRATPMTIDALTTGPFRAAQADTDDGPWEIVPGVLDPLRAAQDRERLAIIVPSESHARPISR